MIAFFSGSLGYILPFLIVLTVLVFVHELGHYLVARWSGVKVEVFSIGFGPELFGWYDRKGTRWCISAIPFGGYVRMYGDADETSTPSEAVETMTPEQRAVSFHYKKLSARAAILVAGPGANFLFAILLLSVLFATAGEPYTPAQIGSVDPGSAAEASGLKAGDTFISIDGQAIARFEDLQQIVQLDVTNTPLQVVVRRDDSNVNLAVTPNVSEQTDRLGYRHQQGVLGVRHSGVDFVRRDPGSALFDAVGQTWHISVGMVQALSQMIIGARNTDELSGPLGIAKLSGEVARGGVLSLLDFMALLSINLGLVNLFPIPILDGGRLLFYAAEAVLGRPLGHRTQEFGFRLGLALVLTLMIFATWNDLNRFGVIAFLKGLVT